MRRGPVLAPRYPPSFGVLRSSHSGLDGESRFVGTCLKGLALCTGGGWSKGWAHRLTPVMWGSAFGGVSKMGVWKTAGAWGTGSLVTPCLTPYPCYYPRVDQMAQGVLGDGAVPGG